MVFCLLPGFKVALFNYEASASLISVYIETLGGFHLNKCTLFLQGYYYDPRPNYYLYHGLSFAAFIK
jgi:hypothetical protein